MKKNPKHQKVASAAEAKLQLLASDMQKVLEKHGIKDAKLKGFELHLGDDQAAVSAGTASKPSVSTLSGCVVLPGGIIRCG